MIAPHGVVQEALVVVAAVTVSVVLHMVEPPDPQNVPIYVVVMFGATLCEPLGGTVPMLEMAPAVAFVEFHERVEVAPAVMVDGLTLSAHVGAGGRLLLVVPPQTLWMVALVRGPT